MAGPILPGDPDLGTFGHVAGTEAQARRGSQPQVLSTLFSETRGLIWLDQLDSEPQDPPAPASPVLG